MLNSGDNPSPQAGFSRITINPKLVFREVGKLSTLMTVGWNKKVSDPTWKA